MSDILKLKKHNTEVLITDSNGNTVKYYTICTKLSRMPIDFIVLGYIHKNQFLVTRLMSLGGNEIKQDDNEEIITLLSEQFNWNTEDSAICLLRDKLVCKDCNSFPCICVDKKKREKTLDVPIQALGIGHKIKLAEHSANLAPIIGEQLALDKDKTIRRELCKYTDREILINRAIDLFTKDKEEIDVVIALFGNQNMPSFLVVRLWDITKEQTLNNNDYRDCVVSIVQHPNVPDNLPITIYEYMNEMGYELTPDEQIAFCSSDGFDYNYKNIIRENCVDSDVKLLLDEIIERETLKNLNEGVVDIHGELREEE